jgi:hypothetical protein
MKPRRGRPNLAGLEPHRACSIFKRKLDCAIKKSTGNNIKFSVCSLVTATSNKNCQASQGPRFKLQASAFFSFLFFFFTKRRHLRQKLRLKSRLFCFLQFVVVPPQWFSVTEPSNVRRPPTLATNSTKNSGQVVLFICEKKNCGISEPIFETVVSYHRFKN